MKTLLSFLSSSSSNSNSPPGSAFSVLLKIYVSISWVFNNLFVGSDSESSGGSGGSGGGNGRTLVAVDVSVVSSSTAGGHGGVVQSDNDVETRTQRNVELARSNLDKLSTLFLVRDWNDDIKKNDAILPGFPFYDEKDLYVLGAKLTTTTTSKMENDIDDDVFISLFTLNHAAVTADADVGITTATTTDSSSSSSSSDDGTMYVNFECYLHEHDKNLCLTKPVPMEAIMSNVLVADDSKIKTTTWQANISNYINKQELEKYSSSKSSSLSMRVHFFLKKHNDERATTSSSSNKKKGSHYYRGNSSPASTKHVRLLTTTTATERATNNNNKKGNIVTASPTMVVTIPLSTGYVGVIGTNNSGTTTTTTSKDINVVYLQEEEDGLLEEEVTATARK